MCVCVGCPVVIQELVGVSDGESVRLRMEDDHSKESKKRNVTVNVMEGMGGGCDSGLLRPLNCY